MGIIGEPRVSVKRELKLPAFTAMFELDMNKLVGLVEIKQYVKLSNYPKTEQDVCFKLPTDVSYMAIQELVVNELTKLTKNSHYTLAPLDVYRKRRIRLTSRLPLG